MIHGGDVLLRETTPGLSKDAFFASAETFTPEDTEANKSGVGDALWGYFLKGKKKIRKR